MAMEETMCYPYQGGVRCLSQLPTSSPGQVLGVDYNPPQLTEDTFR